MKGLIAFRCRDGSYLLVPQAASAPWHDNPSVEFLGGEVGTDSFEPGVGSRIEREIAQWQFAVVAKEAFWFSWSQTQERARQGATTEPVRTRRRGRLLAAR